jgi:hypothetical protein
MRGFVAITIFIILFKIICVCGDTIDLYVELNNVPDTSNISLLCQEIIIWYQGQSSTNYCSNQTNFETSGVNYKIDQVIFKKVNQSSSSTPNLARKPTELNDQLRNVGFFLKSDGEIYYVAPSMAHLKLVALVVTLVFCIVEITSVIYFCLKTT